MKYPKPNVCTSLSGCNNTKHCRECSHAVYKARLKGRKKSHYVQFEPLFGPLFALRPGDRCNWTPNARHPLWKAFYKWHEEKFGKGNK